MMKSMEGKHRVLDWVNLVVAVLLFLSPWVLNFSGERTASWNAWMSAVAIGVIAIAAISAFAQWEEWLNLILGIWVVISPWVLGIGGIAAAAWSHVILGLIVAVLAAWELWLTRHVPPQVTA